VDNIVRAVPNLISFAKDLSTTNPKGLQSLFHGYDNRVILRQCVDEIQSHLTRQFQ
jgi:phosphopantothenate synthetase